MAPKYALSDSESEPEADTPNVPSDTTLEQALRDEVTSRFETGRREEITVKRVRLAVEEKLKLEAGFFRATGDWKGKSEEIIRNQVDQQEAGEEEDEEEDEAPQPAKAKSPPQPKKSAPKRPKSDTAPKPRKRQKTETPASEEEEGDEEPEPSGDDSEEEAPKPKKRITTPVKKTKAKPTKQASPEASDAPDDEPKPTEASAGVTKDDSESEMSVVFDEEPKPAPKRQKTTGAPKEKKKAAPKAKDDDADPDQAEIKRLQGWLVKCGIRKMWWRELQPYETPKAKIKHLKGMLEDAGMKGRYSLDKARQIRDQRELKADLEQIQQGAKDWGKASGDEGEGGDAEVPQRRAARGRQALAFLESDGEETD